jgi:uncharacterized membrane protein YhaH (DUF805 family)
MLGHLFSFKGRTNRVGYLGIGFVQGMVIAIAVVILTVLFKGGHSPLAVMAPAVIICVAALFVTVWLGLAVMARRLRDMGLPPGPSLAVILAISAAGQLAQVGHHGLGAFTPMALLFGGISALIGFALLFWPSAPTQGLGESKLDDIFGEVAPELDKPVLVKAPSRIMSVKPAPAAQPVFHPAPQPSVRDASGRVVPRGQFGLRQSY